MVERNRMKSNEIECGMSDSMLTDVFTVSPKVDEYVADDADKGGDPLRPEFDIPLNINDLIYRQVGFSIEPIVESFVTPTLI